MTIKTFQRKIKPFEILTGAQVEAIHRGALRTLEQTGVQFESKRALQLFEKGGCKVDYDQRRARVPAELADTLLRQIPPQFTMRSANPDHNLTLGGDGLTFAMFSGLRTVDLDTWDTRVPTVQDNHDANKISDGLENVHGSTSYTPYCDFVDVSPVMLLPISTWSRLKYFSKVNRIGSAVDSHIFEIQMAQALGVDVYAAFEASPPLTFSEAASDCGVAAAEAGFPVEAGCGGMMGASHPATLSGSLVTGMTEVMAAAVLTQLVRPGTPMIFNSFDIPINMRTGAPRFGSIAISLFQVCWNQIWRSVYGVPVMNGGVGPSDAKQIDFQNGYEKGIGILLSALSGANMINTIGGLTGELSYHPVQAVLDNDIAGMIGRFVEGVDVSDETLALDLIAEVGPIPGFYMDQAHTRKWWRSEQYITRFADHLPYPEWLEKGKKAALDYARERSDELLAKYKPAISPEKDRELDCILADAESYYRRKGLL